MCSEAAAVSSAYVIRTAKEDDAELIQGVANCQEFFAEYHHTLYQQYHPALTREYWYDALGCGVVRRVIQQGALVQCAVQLDTGDIVGYISWSLAAATSACPHIDERNRCADIHAAEQAASISINHIVVLPTHRGRGVGRLLFDAFYLHPLRNKAPVEITAVEQNHRVVGWYRRMGFDVVKLHVSERQAGCPICFVNLRRADGSGSCPLEIVQLFNHEIVGLGVWWQQRAKRAKDRSTCDSAESAEMICGYDACRGLHQLADGALLDVAAAYACGRLRFQRPLHEIFHRSPPNSTSPGHVLEPSGSASDVMHRRQSARISSRKARLELVEAILAEVSKGDGNFGELDEDQIKGDVIMLNPSDREDAGYREEHAWSKRKGEKLGSNSLCVRSKRARAKEPSEKTSLGSVATDSICARSHHKREQDAGDDVCTGARANEPSETTSLCLASPDNAHARSGFRREHDVGDDARTGEKVAPKKSCVRSKHARGNEPSEKVSRGLAAPGDMRARPRQKREQDVGEDFCVACKKGGRLLLCDGHDREGRKCNATYHCRCVGLHRVPIGEWLCPRCSEAAASASAI